ncbi:MAG: MFS transporter [Candidatus Puniceispirillales bacterium WSBS_2018_MAG_OTU23]
MVNFIKSISRNVWLLVLAQGIGMTTLNVNIIVVGLSGLLIAPEPWMATVPLSLQFVASMLATLPASLAMGKFGRKPIFMLGVLFITIGMAGQGLAMVYGSFPWFIFASLLVGVAHGIGQYYRYAAADSVAEDQKSVVVSLVIGGGLIAALFGAFIVKNSITFYPDVVYAGCFFAGAGLQVFAAIILIQLDLGKPLKTISGGRPLAMFFKNPRFITAITAAGLGYGVMSFMMTAAPLQIVSVSQLGDGANATVIQWHVIAMFAPSFFMGSLIKRFGVERVMFSGLLLYIFSVVIALNGTSFWHYFIVLALIGGGWNTLYVGGSSIIAAIAEPIERSKVQGIADFIIIFIVAASSLTAGALHFLVGWEAMAKLVLIPIAIIALMITVMIASEHRAKIG